MVADDDIRQASWLGLVSVLLLRELSKRLTREKVRSREEDGEEKKGDQSRAVQTCVVSFVYLPIFAYLNFCLFGFVCTCLFLFLVV